MSHQEPFIDVSVGVIKLWCLCQSVLGYSHNMILKYIFCVLREGDSLSCFHGVFLKWGIPKSPWVSTLKWPMIWGSPILRNLRIATLGFHVKFRVVTSKQSISIDSATSIISHIVNEQCTTLDDHGLPKDMERLSYSPTMFRFFWDATVAPPSLSHCTWLNFNLNLWYNWHNLPSGKLT